MEKLKRFFMWVGIVGTAILCGRSVLTLFTPVPALTFWFAGAALFQAAAFLFASAVGVMGLQTLPRVRYWCLMGLAVILAGGAWWQAADQAMQTHEIQQRITAGVQAIGEPETIARADGTWLTKRRIHFTGAVANKGVVLRFYGADVKSFELTSLAACRT